MDCFAEILFPFAGDFEEIKINVPDGVSDIEIVVAVVVEASNLCLYKQVDGIVEICFYKFFGCMHSFLIECIFLWDIFHFAAG